MHPSAMEYGRLFFDVYCKKMSSATVLDIGAKNVNGSLKEVCPKNFEYIGADFDEGKGVDVVLKDPYKYPFKDKSADAIVCTSCFEHAEFFWLSFLEMLRVLKPHGVLYINAPSNGHIHRAPTDCWRFYPDAASALVKWAGRNGYDPALLESFTGKKFPSHPWFANWDETWKSVWSDYVAVFVKEKKQAAAYDGRICLSVEGCINCMVPNKSPELMNFSPATEDFKMMEALKGEIVVLKKAIGA